MGVGIGGGVCVGTSQPLTSSFRVLEIRNPQGRLSTEPCSSLSSKGRSPFFFCCQSGAADLTGSLCIFLHVVCITLWPFLFWESFICSGINPVQHVISVFSINLHRLYFQLGSNAAVLIVNGKYYLRKWGGYFYVCKSMYDCRRTCEHAQLLPCL